MAIAIKQRTHQKLIYSIKTPSGGAADLTGATISFLVAPSVSGAVTFEKTIGAGISVPDPVTGRAEVSLDSTDTNYVGTYYLEVLIVDSSGYRRIIAVDEIQFSETNPNH